MGILCYVVGCVGILINVKFTMRATMFYVKVSLHDFFLLLCLFFCYSKGSSRPHMETVERIPCQVLLPSVPADC